MKKITFLFFLIFLGKTAFTQVTYFNYLDHSSEWRHYLNEWVVLSFHDTYATSYFDGDTSILGVGYYKKFISVKKIQEDPFGGPDVILNYIDGPFYVREDASGKFYERNMTTGIDAVTFDNQQVANAQVGQPFPEVGGSCNVSAIQYLNLGSTPLKKIMGALTGNLTGSVEGVGAIGMSCSLLIEGSYVLVCYSKQGDNVQFVPISCDSFPIPIRTNTLSLESNSLTEQLIDVYPNPTEGTFTIHSSKSVITESYQLFDINGVLLKEGILTESNQEIAIEDYSSGIYILKIRGDNSTITKRIVKN